MDTALNRHRIGTIDAFRFISITLVICFHYFVRFSSSYDKQSHYPYDNALANITLFRYGFEGVKFFFIISGFVITMTLQHTNGLKEFALKRFIRLWPSLLVCTMLTFIVLSVSPIDGFTTAPHYLLSTLTITEPKAWTKLLHFKSMDFVDGVVWSLVCEVYFYIVSSLLYFWNRALFFRNWLIYATLMICSYLVLKHIGAAGITYYIELILFPQYLTYFTAGIYFYMLYTGRQLSWPYHIAVIALVFIQAIYLQSYVQICFSCVFYLLFIIFIYKHSWLSFLNNSVIRTLGVMSYPLYLIHQNIGIVLINKFSVLFNSTLVIATVTPALIIVLIAAFYVEKWMTGYVSPYLKRALIKK